MREYTLAACADSAQLRGGAQLSPRASRRSGVALRLLYCAAVPSHARAGVIVTVTVAIAVAFAGCGSARDGGAGQLLTPDATGWVDRSTTGTTGIQGPWYAFTDGESCLSRHTAAECSVLVTPDPADPIFAPTANLGMCAVGVIAKVIPGPGPDGQLELDWSNMWGARIAFALDAAGYDAPAHGVTGLAFHIDAEPARGAEMTVVISTATTGNDPPWWGGATSDTSPVHAGRNEIRWAAVGGPHYFANPPPFDPTLIRTIEFGIKADNLDAKSFAFCINELTALTD